MSLGRDIQNLSGIKKEKVNTENVLMYTFIVLKDFRLIWPNRELSIVSATIAIIVGIGIIVVCGLILNIKYIYKCCGKINLC